MQGRRVSWSGTSKLIECTTTTVRSTSPIDRSVTVGQMSLNRAWSSTNDCSAMRGRYSGHCTVASVTAWRERSTDVIAVAGGAGNLGPTRRPETRRRGLANVRLRTRPGRTRRAERRSPARSRRTSSTSSTRMRHAPGHQARGAARRTRRRSRPPRGRLARQDAHRGAARRLGLPGLGSSSGPFSTRRRRSRRL